MDDAALLPWVPLWMASLAVIAAVVRKWPDIMDKSNERERDKATAKDNDWTRLREEVERLAGRVKVLEAEAEAWRHRAITAEADNARLKAIEMGFGEVRQRAQEIVSADRQAREAEERGGK